MSLKLGLLYSFRNPAYKRTSWPQVYQDELDMAVYADELGYDNVWMSEHHFVDDGYMPSPLTIAAAVAARTKTIRIGTYILLLPLHDPLRVAETAATIDLISNGRFDLGLGLGYRPGELDGAGVPSSERGARMAEGAPLIQRLFTEQNITFDGRYNTLKDVTLTPPPVQKPHPPIFQPFASSENSIRWCAREGVTAVLPPMHEKHETALSQIYAEESGRPVGEGVAYLRDIVIAETDEEADHLWRESSRFVAETWFEPFGFRRGMIDPDTGEYPDPKEMIEQGYVLVGSVDTVCRRLEALRDRLPVQWIFAWIFAAMTPNDKIKRSLELYIEEVLPKVGLENEEPG